MSSTCTRTSRRTLNPLVAAALLAGALLIGTGVADGSGHAVPGQGVLVPGVQG